MPKKQLEDFEEDVIIAKYEQELFKYKSKDQESSRIVSALLKENFRLNNKVETILGLNLIQQKAFKVKPLRKHKNEATAIMMASDWHLEELVDPATVSFENDYNLEIAKKRVERFFLKGQRLTDMYRQDIEVKKLVLWLGGDLINGYIHEENLENNQLSPLEAKQFALNLISKGLNFLLNNGNYKKIYVLCNYGNHGRTTIRKRYATGYKNNYEWDMYCSLQQLFQNEKKIKFIIPKSSHSYINIYGRLVRGQHGDNLRYWGGVSGIYLAANKAKANWKEVYLDLIGHFHQSKLGTGSDRNAFNGSLIGKNAYSVDNKFKSEPPLQGHLILEKEKGLTFASPIFVSDKFY